MIISVPHTGTLALRQYLCEQGNYSWCIEDPNYNVQMGCWHFGENDRDIAMFNGRADVPIRDPFDNVISWLSRYPEGHEYRRVDEFQRWDLLMAYVANRPHTTFWPIEKIPVRINQGPSHWARDRARRKQTLKLSRVRRLRDWIKQGERLAFFQQFYPSFWWLDG